MYSCRVTVNHDVKMTAASLVTSDTWRLNTGNRIQRLEPFTLTPIPGTSTRMRRITEMMPIGFAIFSQTRIGTWYTKKAAIAPTTRAAM